MDSPGFHKSAAARSAVRNAGARLFSAPKYAPGPNPAERFFSKLEHSLTKAARRGGDGVRKAAAGILKTAAPHECASRVKTAGHEYG